MNNTKKNFIKMPIIYALEHDTPLIINILYDKIYRYPIYNIINFFIYTKNYLNHLFI